MKNHSPQNLLTAVTAICPDIVSRVNKNSRPLNERRLWWELSSCILSSQVPYALAIAVADKIDEEKILINHHKDSEILMQQLSGILKAPLMVDRHLRTYRFPTSRARHLAKTRVLISSQKSSLHELMDSFQDATEARAWFVKHVPGLGPKQASMFLRNAGKSYDLAILDRHVLNYMSELGFYTESHYYISGLAQYRRYEAVLRKHAQELNCPVGILDWAIWIVMRVANRNTEVVV